MPLDFSGVSAPFSSLSASAQAGVLSRLYEGDTAQDVLGAAIRWDFRSRIALVSSFGAESAALLHMVAEVDPSTPVLFLETGMLFPETLAYQQELAARLGLTDLRLIRADSGEQAAEDADGLLHQSDADACCALRKTRPLQKALGEFDAWITGRKRGQSSTRHALQLFESDAAHRVKLNPLADWSAEDVRAYMQAHDLPPHPLVASGYPSIGCAPCTTPVRPGEDPRAGRWRGRDKVECGIHVENGKIIRTPREKAAPMDGA